MKHLKEVKNSYYAYILLEKYPRYNVRMCRLREIINYKGDERNE